MTRLSRLALAAVGAALVGGAATSGAQSAPPIAAPKRAAQRAVAATNAHTEKMTGDQGTPIAEKRIAAPRGDSAASPSPASAAAPAATPGGASISAPTGARSTAAVRRPPVVDTNRSPASAQRQRTPVEASFRRETFAYDRGGRRDPFVSLMTSGEIRPLINDIRLVGVVAGVGGHNSVAMLRDLVTDEQYRVKVGQTLGRMRVSRIEPKKIVFMLEEFGFSRQAELSLEDSNSERKR
jgi:hypothetical protein